MFGDGTQFVVVLVATVVKGCWNVCPYPPG